MNVPKGCTSRIQPLDVSINKPFNGHIQKKLEEHIDQNIEKYTNDEPSAAERRVLATKWVGSVWGKIKQDTHLIKWSFLEW